jgi:anti-sigma regulatory factor (Ser/Thr protein kinase)
MRADGSSTFLTDAGGPPLGTGEVGDYDQQRVTLGPAQTLLFYTDGLIERRGATLSEGEAALVEAASAAPEEPELLCRTVIERLTEDIEPPDDIAVLAVRAVGLHEQLDVEVPAEAEQLATVRHLIRRWVTAHGGTDDDCAAFAIAVTEACANAVEHAYGPGDATIDLNATLLDGEATVTVRDRGSWREPRRENRGRGIPVMKEFMDDVAIDTGEQGTRVELRRQIGGSS